MQEHFARHIAWTSDEPLGLAVASAKGPFIVLEDGRRILDCISGIAVSSIGHRHPKVVEAVREQLDRHLHVMVYGEFVQRPQVAFAARLCKELPRALQSVFYTMTGTEANEGALKLARKYTGRTKVVAFDGAYHGSTVGALSVTGREVYRKPFEPLMPGVTFLPFNDLAALQAIDEDTACVITEPIQGEGGVHVPSEAWMQALRKRCTDMGALLIFDEIQTGFGRTGTLFAFERMDVIPDVLTIAKAMGGGMPLGALIASQTILGAFRTDPPLGHVTTFGGHPVSCAAALAALEVVLDENLPTRALRIEEAVRAQLVHAHIKEIRGRGALLGIALESEAVTQRLVERCLDQGLLLGWTLHAGNLVRFAPPLNVDFDLLGRAIETILATLDAA